MGRDTKIQQTPKTDDEEQKSGTSKSSEIIVGAIKVSSFQGRVLIFMAFIVLSAILVGVGAWYHHEHRQRAVAAAPVAATKLPAASDRLVTIEDTPELDPQTKVDAEVALAFQAYDEGDYKLALTIGKKYIDNTYYHFDITCNLLFKIYDIQHDAINLKNTAQDCVNLTLATNPQSKVEKGARLYQLGLYYHKANDDQKSRSYYQQFVSYVKENKIEQDEVLADYYIAAQKAIK